MRHHLTRNGVHLRVKQPVMACCLQRLVLEIAVAQLVDSE